MKVKVDGKAESGRRKAEKKVSGISGFVLSDGGGVEAWRFVG